MAARFRFRLRSLLLALSLVAPILWILHIRIERARQAKAVARLLNCELESLAEKVPSDSLVQSNVLRMLLGDNSYVFIESVDSSPSGNALSAGSARRLVTFQELRAITYLPNLKELFLNHTTVDDSSMLHLQSLNELEFLAISDTSITNDSLSILGRLPNLQNLSLARTNVTDAGIEKLRRLTHLKALDLSDTNVTTNCITFLAEMSQLTELYLNGTRVDDAAMKHLGQLNNLELLDLSRTNVKGKSLRTLSALPNLRYLDLADTPISDAAINDLLLLKQLDSINLSGTQVSDVNKERIAELHVNR